MRLKPADTTVLGAADGFPITAATAITRIRTKLAAVWLAIVVLACGFFMGVGASPAHAATCPRVDVGYTIKQGIYIKGSGSTPCGGATITLQQRYWWGWGDLASVYTSGSPRTVAYQCSYSGTQTYRTTVSYWSNGGGFIFKESNHLRVYC